MAGRVNEGVTAQYTAQLVDENDDNLPLSSLYTITLTLYDQLSDSIINSRDGQDVKNANNIVINSTGFLTWTLQAADNVIVNPSLDSEVHVALFEGTYGTLGAKPFNHEFRYRVVNLNRVG